MNKGIKLLFLALLAGILLLVVMEMRDFGDPKNTEMDDHFIANSQGQDTSGSPREDGRSTNNVVTAIVFDYRGFDTLGEATVLFAAVCGVLVALRAAFGRSGQSTAQSSKGGGDQ